MWGIHIEYFIDKIVNINFTLRYVLFFCYYRPSNIIFHIKPSHNFIRYVKLHKIHYFIMRSDPSTSGEINSRYLLQSVTRRPSMRGKFICHIIYSKRSPSNKIKWKDRRRQKYKCVLFFAASHRWYTITWWNRMKVWAEYIMQLLLYTSWTRTLSWRHVFVHISMWRQIYRAWFTKFYSIL